MKKLVLFALALGSLAAACTSPTTIVIPTGGGDTDNDNGAGATTNTGTGVGNTGNGGSGGEDISTDTPKEATAHDVYVKEVYPSIMATCGVCHIPTGLAENYAFLDNDVELSYVETKAYAGVIPASKNPGDSALILQPKHTGEALTDEQKGIVGKWIDMEIKEGATDPGTTTTGGSTNMAPTLESMLGEFGKCMEFDLWDSEGMDLFPLQQTNGQGQCASCHNQGTGAVFLSADPLETFDMNTAYPYIMRLVTPVYEGATPVDLTMSNRLLNKGKEPCPEGSIICHPKYELNEANKAAFEGFVSKTLSKWKNKQCAP